MIEFSSIFTVAPSIGYPLLFVIVLAMVRKQTGRWAQAARDFFPDPPDNISATADPS